MVTPVIGPAERAMPRLGPQDAVAGFGERGAERVGVLAAVAAVGGQDYDVGPVALSVGVGLDGYRSGGEDFAVPVHGFLLERMVRLPVRGWCGG
jgi:hypothetical protein